LARLEKQQQVIEERLELEKRMTLESIDGVYIPKTRASALQSWIGCCRKLIEKRCKP
jgi:hypothetical protein